MEAAHWLDRVRPVRVRTTKGRTVPADEPAVVLDAAVVEARFGLAFGPVTRALVALCLRADPARPNEAFLHLGLKRQLSFDFLFHAASEIEAEPAAGLAPFATDHKSYYAFDTKHAPGSTDDAPIMFVDWEEGERPRRIASGLLEWLRALANDASEDTDDVTRMRYNIRLLTDEVAR